MSLENVSDKNTTSSFINNLNKSGPSIDPCGTQLELSYMN